MLDGDLAAGLVDFFTSRVLIGAVASVGFIALLGIAVLNGVVLVSYSINCTTRG